MAKHPAHRRGPSATRCIGHWPKLPRMLSCPGHSLTGPLLAGRRRTSVRGRRSPSSPHLAMARWPRERCFVRAKALVKERAPHVARVADAGTLARWAIVVLHHQSGAPIVPRWTHLTPSFARARRKVRSSKRPPLAAAVASFARTGPSAMMRRTKSRASSILLCSSGLSGSGGAVMASAATSLARGRSQSPLRSRRGRPPRTTARGRAAGSWSPGPAAPPAAAWPRRWGRHP